MKKIILILISLFSILTMTAQPEIEWQKNLGGQNYDEANSIIQTSDGGYIAAGHSSSANGDVSANNGGQDIWIVKLDASGTIEWEQNYGGSEDEQAYDIDQTSDGGYIVIGNSESDDFIGVTGYIGFEDIIILKLDSLGALEWGKFHGSSNNDRSHSIEQTADGGYIASGEEGSDGTFQFWVAKLDSNGDLDVNWTDTTFGEEYNDSAHAAIQTNDGGYMAVGFAKYGVQGVGIMTDFWVIKFTANGIVEWEQIMGGSSTDVANAVYQTTDGGYIIAGNTRSDDGSVTNYHGKEDIWVVKLDAQGVMEWQRAIGGAEDEEAYSVFQSSDGNYVISGSTESIDGDVSNAIGTISDNDFWLVKLDGSGDIIWDKSLGGSVEDFNYAAQLTSDDGYILAGSTNSSNFDVTGTNGGYDFWVVKLGSETLGVDQNETIIKLEIHPNPVSETLFITSDNQVDRIDIYDILGKKILSLFDKNQVEVSSIPSGVYIMQILTNKGSVTKKIIINH